MIDVKRPTDPEERLRYLEGQVDALCYLLGLATARAIGSERTRLLADAGRATGRATDGTPYDRGYMQALVRVSEEADRASD